MAEGAGPGIELARFLRARRERIRPGEVGFPVIGHRRTPGLRREEVAVLAGVSTTWYTYLEQGRGREVSPRVLDSIGQVLQLTEDERRHTHILAYGKVITPQPLTGELPGNELVKRLVGVMSDSPYPVYAADLYYDLIAWNDAAAEWYDDWGKLDINGRNIMRWLIRSPVARQRLVEWEIDVRDTVARWHAMTSLQRSDVKLQLLVSEFCALSEDFTKWWNAYEIMEHRSHIRVFRHPRLGVRRLRTITVGGPEFAPSFVVFHASAEIHQTPAG